MTEEHRDPELESVRAEWAAPPPTSGFHARVLSAYDGEFRQRRWLRLWPVVAVAFAAGLVLAFVIAPHLLQTETVRYVPVQQPRFIIISQGEHP
jgi:hypothetical protein